MAELQAALGTWDVPMGVYSGASTQGDEWDNGCNPAIFGVSGGRPSATEFMQNSFHPALEPEMKRAKGRVIEPLALPEGEA